MTAEQEAIERLRIALKHDDLPMVAFRADLRALLDSHERMRAALGAHHDPDDGPCFTCLMMERDDDE